jgi:hypothetical protein
MLAFDINLAFRISERFRHGGHQRLRIEVARSLEDIVGLTRFDDLAAAHDKDPVADVVRRVE